MHFYPANSVTIVLATRPMEYAKCANTIGAVRRRAVSVVYHGLLDGCVLSHDTAPPLTAVQLSVT